MFLNVLLFLSFFALFCALVNRVQRKTRFDAEWRHVPPPNWRCRRGGVDYL